MMEKFDFKNLPKQTIVGKASLVDVNIYNNKREFLKDSNKHLGSSMVKYGKYGFILKNVKRLDPIKMKGKLGFFEVEL